jgi:microcystin degradation protein MlrC
VTIRIGIAGLAVECSTFSPHRTTLADFTVTTGAALLARYPFLDPAPGWADGVEWVPLLHAVALPGGAVTGAAYAELAAGITGRLAAAGRLDGVFLDLHGAVSVPGRDDVEAGLVAEVRALAGPGVLLSASMDLHGNVSRSLAAELDLVTCYRTAPHVDVWETRERAARLLVERVRSGRGRPVRAWVPVPVLLPGEKTSTRLEPAAGIYAEVARVAARPGVLDAAVWVGYAWADEPRCRAAVVVTGDDAGAVVAGAAGLARRYWDARAGFGFVAPAGTLAECVAAGLAARDRRPFFVSDSGDNPTAGGAGDVSWTLARLLELPGVRAAEVIHASIVDPAAVAAAVAAGAGGVVRVAVGGRIDAGPCGPVPVTAVVDAVAEDPVGGTVAVLRVDGLRFVVTARRMPFHREADFTRLGLDPRAADLVVVKIGYLEPELYALAAGWMLALTPGGVDQDLLRLGHRRLARPVFPFDPDLPDPDLTPELL